MAVNSTPPVIAKVALTAGRALHQPFEVPTELSKAAFAHGEASHNLIGSVNAATAAAVETLSPRGPAKLLSRLFEKVDTSLSSSAQQAFRAQDLIWKPLSEGSIQVGHAVSNPFAHFYATKSGFTLPTDPDALGAELAKITNPNADSTKWPGWTWPQPAAAEQPAPTPPAGDGGSGGEPPAPTPPAGGDGGETPTPTPPAGDGGDTPTPTPPAGDGGEAPTPTPPAGDGGEAPTPTPPADGGGEPPAPAPTAAAQ
jgi:hypothetical protein